jgi:hypothetical protein
MRPELAMAIVREARIRRRIPAVSVVHEQVGSSPEHPIDPHAGREAKGRFAKGTEQLPIGENTPSVTYDVLMCCRWLEFDGRHAGRACSNASTEGGILSRRICHTSPCVHVPAEKGEPPPLAVVG